MAKPLRAQAVSRILSGTWGHSTETLAYPLVYQAGSGMVMVESPFWRSLGWAAHILARRGGYAISWGGQWLDRDRRWDGWLEVRRA